MVCKSSKLELENVYSIFLAKSKKSRNLKILDVTKGPENAEYIAMLLLTLQQLN